MVKPLAFNLKRSSFDSEELLELPRTQSSFEKNINQRSTKSRGFSPVILRFLLTEKVN